MIQSGMVWGMGMKGKVTDELECWPEKGEVVYSRVQTLEQKKPGGAGGGGENEMEKGANCQKQGVEKLGVPEVEDQPTEREGD